MPSPHPPPTESALRGVENATPPTDALANSTDVHGQAPQIPGLTWARIKPSWRGMWLALRQPDIRNVCLIALAFLLMVVILPPTRDWYFSDEVLYGPSLQQFFATHQYVRPDLAEPNLVGMIWWAWAFMLPVGFSYTALSVFMLFCSFLTLVGFYGLLRVVSVTPGVALLGVALLGLNPLYLLLSHVYLTEVPFLCLLFYSCICFVLGLQGKGWGWFALGSALAGYDFLIRQYAIFIPIAVLGYMALAWRWRWGWALATVIPAAIPIFFFLRWQFSLPPNAGTALQLMTSQFIMTPAWGMVIVDRLIIYLPLLGLFTWPLLWVQRQRRLILLPIWSGLLLLAVLSQSFVPQPQIHKLYNTTFDGYGNLIMRSGVDFFRYRAPMVLNDIFWNALVIIGAILFAIYLTRASSSLTDWILRLFKSWRSAWHPVAIVYFIGLMIAVPSFALTGYMFDRYILAFVPMALVFLLRDTDKWSRIAWGWAITATLLLGGFSLTLNADFIDHASVRWNAVQWILGNGIKPDAIWLGYEWEVPYGSGDCQRPYQVGEIPCPGGNYRVVKAFPYFSRLGGFTDRPIYVWERSDVTPSLQGH